MRTQLYSIPVLPTQLGTYLSEGKHIALHCRQGLGRAPLIAASVLVFNDIAPELAFDLLSKTRGYPVPETEEQVRWAVALSQYRNNLLNAAAESP